MSGLLPRTERVSRRASRRGAISALIDRTGRWLVIAGGLALVAVGAWKLFPPIRSLTPWWVLISAPIGVAAMAAAAVSLARRWSSLRAARELDERLGLRDRLSSAWELSRATPADPFVEIAVREAERLSDGVDVRDALPLRWGKGWVVWPALATAAIAVGLFVPLRRVETGPDAATRRAAAKTASQQVAAVAAGARGAVEARELDPRTQQSLDDFDRIEQELAEGRTTPEEARVKAARQLEETAAQIRKEAENRQAAADQAKRTLAESARSTGPAADALGADAADGHHLRRALAEGDLDSAAAAARQVAQKLETMSPEEREALARDLAEIARKLETQRQEPPSPREGEPHHDPDVDAPPVQSGESSPKDQETGEQSGSQQDAAPPSDEPETTKHGDDRPPADAQADPKPSEEPRPEQPKENSSTNRLSEALRKAAEEIKRSSNPQPSEGKPPPESKPNDQAEQESQPAEQQEKPGEKNPQQGTQQTDQSGTNPDPKSRPVEKTDGKQGAQRRPSDVESRRPTPSQTGRESPEASPRPNPSGTPEPGAKQVNREGGQKQPEGAKDGKQTSPQPGADPKASPPDTDGNGAPKTSDQNQKSGSPRSNPSGAKQPGTSPKPSDSAEPKESPPTERPGGESPGSVPDPNKLPSLEKLARELQNLEKTGRDAEQNKELAKRFQEQARKLLENASPEDLKRLSEAARQHALGTQAGEGPGESQSRPTPAWEGKSELVDARGTQPPSDGGQDRVISESPSAPDRPGNAGPAHVSGQAVRQAAAGAQRAVEQQTVPPQYGPFVKRVFKRFVERAGAEKAAPTSTPDAPDAVRKQ